MTGDPALDVPETEDFMLGVQLEADHQRRRWGAAHDAGKTPFDWFWLIGFLAQKAASAAVSGDADKAKHHTISTAAALANWHLALSGGDTRMRPGIEPPAMLADDLGTIGPGHVCAHGIRHPHACQPCDDAAWSLHRAALLRAAKRGLE